MKYFLIISLLSFSISCSLKKSQTESTTVNQITKLEFNTELTITKSIPYCGGARPTEDMLNRFEFVTTHFILIDENNIKKEVKSNSKGIINLQLPKGKYHLKEVSKNMPFEKFYSFQSNDKGKYIEVGKRDCYNKWWKKNVINFEIIEPSKLLKASGKLYSNCYTKNPCDRYTGPQRP